jgi:hypothetical protein
MYTNVSREIAQTRIADLHRQGQRDMLARQGRRPHQHQPRRRVLRLPVIAARRALTA